MPPPRPLVRNAALNLLGQGLPLLAALPAIPLILGGAGPGRLGLLAIAWAVIGYLGVLDLGVSRALTWAVADRVGRERQGELRGLVRSGVGLAAGCGLLAGGLILLAAGPLARLLTEGGALQEEALVAIRLVALASPFVVLTGVLRGVLEGLHRFGVVNAIRIPLGVATFLAPLAVLPWTNHLGALVGALLLARLGGWGGYAWATRRALVGVPRGDEAPGPGARPRRPPSLELLRYGGWATVSNVLGPLMVTFDRVLIGATLGAVAVAFYSTPFEVVHRLVIVPSAVMAVFFPAFAQGLGRTPDLFRGSVEGILLLLLPPALLLFAFAPEGLTLWVGTDFAEAGSGVARWLVVGVVLNAVAHIPFAHLQGRGRPRVTALIHLVEFPLYIGALALALPRYGIEGAAMVWAARSVLDLGLLLGASLHLDPELRGTVARALLWTFGAVATLPVLLLLDGLPGGRAAWVIGVGGVTLRMGWIRLRRAWTERAPAPPPG